MVKKSKLLLALDAHKGRDYKREYQKKLTKAADKKKKAKSGQNSGVQLGQKKVWMLELDFSALPRLLNIINQIIRSLPIRMLMPQIKSLRIMMP